MFDLKHVTLKMSLWDASEGGHNTCGCTTLLGILMITIWSKVLNFREGGGGGQLIKETWSKRITKSPVWIISCGTNSQLVHVSYANDNCSAISQFFHYISILRGRCVTHKRGTATSVIWHLKKHMIRRIFTRLDFIRNLVFSWSIICRNKKLFGVQK